MFQWLIDGFKYLWEGNATEESDTERDGFLSYSGEWHSFTSGLRKGLYGMKPTPETPDAKKEARYFHYGHMVGRGLSMLIAVVAGANFL